MSDTNPSAPGGGTPDPAGEIPLAEGSAAPPPSPAVAPKTQTPLKPSLSAEPLIKLVENMPCPKCNADMAHDAVVCLKCGYDMAAGRVRETAVGKPVEVAAAPAANANDFSKPGKLDALALVIIGALLLAGAMFFAGWYAPPNASAGVRAARVGLTVLEAAIHTGTGLIACVAAAVLSRMQVGRVDLAAARVFVCFAAFLLITRFHYDPAPDANTIVKGGIAFVQWVTAMGIYWLLAMTLFWKKPSETGLLGGIHLLLYLTLTLIVGAQALLQGVAAGGVGGTGAGSVGAGAP